MVLAESGALSVRPSSTVLLEEHVARRPGRARVDAREHDAIRKIACGPSAARLP